ncbi:MAG TPA: hypothetical protein VGG48_15690 [Rhizomicrobium sp.]|jgi:hypothetical protein
MRIVIAGLLGAIAMFLWSFVAHMVTPLATIGFSPIPNEAPVVQAMQSSIGSEQGLFIFPWVDPKDPQMMQKTSALMKTEGSGILIYSPPGRGSDPMKMGPMLAVEFVKQFAESTIAAWLVAMMVGLSFFGRLGAVTLVGVAGGIVTNVSYWNWYSFPLNYTLAQIFIEIVAAFVAGLAISWWLGRTARA